MGLFDGFVQAVNREYDRRIKRASEVIEYGMGHGHDHDHDHGHDHNQGQQHEHDESDDDESAIANVPAGTRVEHQQEDV